MSIIKTARLVLMPHTYEAILAWQDKRSLMEKQMGLEPYGLEAEEWVFNELKGAFPVWLKWLNDFPDQSEWYSGWEMVLADANISVGGIGLAGPPDEEGAVLAGYHTDLRHRRQGLALEALDAVCSWCFSRGVKAVRLTIPDWNAASLRLAEKAGFVPAGTKDEDGMHLLVYERKR